MEIVSNPSCNTSTLIPYVPSVDNPWNAAKARHIYRRLGFGAPPSVINSTLFLSPSNFIDSLIDNALALPTAEAPFWSTYSVSDFSNFEEENGQYILDWGYNSINDLFVENLRGRLTIFWMNHFVTELGTYFYAPYMYEYYATIQDHSIGNFKEFTRDIGRTSAMLIYLNGFENTNFSPNENYARELYELFTIGEGNGYTQNDIIETSRALTGYNHWGEPGGSIFFDPSTFDDGEKTIFDQVGNWGYDDVINILFEQRSNEIALSICEKLYAFFVSPAIDQLIRSEIISPLAQTLIDANFELAPMLRQLFKSEHFFDERTVGVIIKSPYDTILNYINENNFFYDDEIIEAIHSFTTLVGQSLYNPPDVSGWQRDEDWISSSTLTGALANYGVLFVFPF